MKSPSVPIMLVLGLMLGVALYVALGMLSGSASDVASTMNPGARVRVVYVATDVALLAVGLCACAIAALRAGAGGWRWFWLAAATPSGYGLVRWMLSLALAHSTGGT